MPSRLVTLTLASTLLVSTLGCEPPVMRARMEIPRKTTEQVTRDLRTVPEVAQLVDELSREAAQGAVAGLLDAETTERVHTLVAQLSRAMLEEVAEGVRGPAGREITAGVTRSLVSSLSAELETKAGPAMRRMIVDELLRQPDFRQALNETTRDVGKHVALGTADAMMKPGKQEKLRALIPGLSDLVPPGLSLALLVALLLAIGAPIAVLLLQQRAARKYREEAERRTAVATALLDAVGAERDDPALRALLARIAASLTSAETAPQTAATPREPPTPGTLHPA